jgi:hypothetical protein
VRLLRTWELTRDKLPKTGVRASAWYQFSREIGEPAVNERLKAESDRWWAEVKDIFKGESHSDVLQHPSGDPVGREESPLSK